MPVTMPGARRVAVVHLPGRERRELEKRRAGIDQRLDALAHRHLALFAMARQILRAAALAHLLEARAVLVDQRLHAIAIGAELSAVDIDVRVEAFHHQPQQSVLNRQEGQRQTACMRYMSAPQRSHFVASSGRAQGGLQRR